MADQITLLSRLFNTLRQVLDSEIEPPHITVGDLELLLSILLPQWQQAALHRDITVRVAGVQALDPSRAASARLPVIENLLQEIFAAALESTPDRGSITVILALQADAPCRLRIKGGDLLSKASFSSRFALPIAKTLVDSSEQEFTYSLNPFEANLILLAPALPVVKSPVLDRSVSADQSHAGVPG